MTTIFERVDDALSLLSPSVPFAMAPYLSDSALPATYIVYQLIDASPEQHADDSETERSNLVQVTIWCTDGLVALPDVDAVMLPAGFMKGRVRQLPKDPQTGHYGLAMEYSYL